MQFKDNSKAIYLQIADRIADSVLAGLTAPGQRLPSVREYAAEVQVNPNTVMRTYETLADAGVIFNRRGIGFFVADDAPAIVRRRRAADFFDNRLPETFAQLRLLDVSPDRLAHLYKEFLENDTDLSSR